MAHEIDMSNGRENVAFIGVTPWHGLGVALEKDAAIDVWQKEAGLEWEAKKSPVTFEHENTTLTMENKNVLYRSDTHAPLGIVSGRYHIVQPAQVMDTYKQLTEDFNCQMEVAGSLKGGQVIWALASTGHDLELGDDKVKGYLLLTTTFDGSSSTTAKFTSVRVVCNNTLELSLNSSSASDVRIPHSRKYQKDEVMGELGLLGDSWKSYHKQVEDLASTKVGLAEAQQWLVNTFGDPKLPLEEQPSARVMRKVMALYMGAGYGATMDSARGTAWGLVNAATQVVDHSTTARTADSRLYSAWMSDGARLKTKAFKNALAMV